MKGSQRGSVLGFVSVTRKRQPDVLLRYFVENTGLSSMLGHF